VLTLVLGPRVHERPSRRGWRWLLLAFELDVSARTEYAEESSPAAQGRDERRASLSPERTAMPSSTPETMRRVVVSRTGITVEQAPIPTPGPDEALVRSVVAGVCGSDTHAAHGRHPFVALPYAPGHEVVGVVTAIGAAVTGVRPGQRVTVEPDLPCWNCKQCLRGQQNLCENLQFFGCGYPQGGMVK
jgi:hypothetical protein